MKRICYNLIILFQLHFLLSQPIPNYYFSSKSSNLLFDAGLNWETLTNFGPVRFNRHTKDQDLYNKSLLQIRGRVGLSRKNDISSLYGLSNLKYKDYFYAYIYPTYTNNIKGNDLSKKPSEFEPFEDYLSGIGFENSWAILQIGRGRESWGAGNDIQLAMSNNSSPYDYFLLASDYGKIRVRYIHGFLENIDQNINRYINSRGIEWTNRRSLIIGFSETIIYSGPNRSIDIGYINPMGSHLEIELNNRLNRPNASDANAVWQMHLDSFFGQKFRLSGNYLFDEFVIDKSEKEEGKEHGRAYSVKLAFTPIFSKSHLLTAYGSIIYVGTHTFRHISGPNNFVHQGNPLGWSRGSDGQEIRVGLNYFNRRNIIASISSGFYQSGEENIIYKAYEPYDNYFKGLFPSGKVDETIFVDVFLNYWYGKYLIFSTGLQWNENNGNNRDVNFMFSIKLFHKFSLSS